MYLYTYYIKFGSRSLASRSLGSVRTKSMMVCPPTLLFWAARSERQNVMAGDLPRWRGLSGGGRVIYYMNV